MHQDIAVIHLKKALKPGDSIKINTPFRVKIPSGNVSRLGHIDQSYQITQWYPKPAVYDKNGWNAMPYLNQGEFYSEYGSFDVSITLPKNYVISATADLQSSKEIDFLNQLAENTKQNLDKYRSKNKLDIETIHFLNQIALIKLFGFFRKMFMILLGLQTKGIWFLKEKFPCHIRVKK